MRVPLDQPVRLTFRTFSDAAETTPADPTTVTLEILPPDQTAVTYTWVGGQVVKDSPGVFHYDYTPATAGHYAYHWHSTGTVATALDGEFDVRAKYDPELVSLEDVKAHLSIDNDDDDDKLQGFIDTATELVESIVGPILARAAAESPTPFYADGKWKLILTNAPVDLSTITVSEWNGTTSQALVYEPFADTDPFTDYGFDADDNGESGIIYRTSGGYPTAWAGRVRVTYTAGRTSVPARAMFAAQEAVRLLWTKAQGMGAAEYPVSLSDFDIAYLTNILGDLAHGPRVA